ncbi:BrnT family toxin [Moraxella nasibovis]|uniref:BrnT family toxin n=1 Tax=Moraxella nasibovis TaxID=2904120 RepID=UPI00241027DD|nr:BrnT family toxin [Moraxella nasibovis]WFF39305.1 BrnT family toxin [Moraxella nasibovis]
MKITYDPAKNQRNIDERGLSFDEAIDFEFLTAKVAVDERFDYGETRYIAVGFLGSRLHVLVFTPICDGIRVISFRKANKREIKDYEQTFN